ncbi:putative ribosome quality control (RQC) complex YloA/Tae2 family protein [Bacillus mesophilus]|uniref:Rqc2 homolog RqcH n=1 Tax=Bacillus mesophilus TaxID=1808955 RepID=A0A6M0Q1Z0_9BACI|nr:NFACT RNA binding domain-containing protein [Bacillus mesophilus]MBM7659423.1 putative ribosome quality control (RQC) complex YloA/Tae2 family protein [Bacillus mesophilus]NEY70296.1 fibronectin/fibrinogen-binding protein [Bacillus mesophilus]
MSFDGVVTRAITEELKKNILGGRISKIYQPYKQELLIHIRGNGQTFKLLISANPSYSRLHFTNEAYENPSEPPMFCMLLRKHLEGNVITSVEQLDMERIIHIETRGRNELGDETNKMLIIEIMGKHSNIVLVEKDRKIILDSIKHISPAVNRHRTILPGYEYMSPPAQEKLNPLTIDEDTFLRKLDFNAGKLANQIVGAFSGISPLFASEVVNGAGINGKMALSQSFFALIEKVKQGEFQPSIIAGNQKEYFYAFALHHLGGEIKTFHSPSEMLDRFYYGKAERDRVRQQGHDLERFIRNEKDKNDKKLVKLQKTLQDAGKAEEYQLLGELLTANMYRLKKGLKSIEVENYYDESNSNVTIPLNPLKSPSDNAQSYYIKYQKAKKSVHFVLEQIENAKAEKAYFESLLQQMETASPKDIQEIREELEEEGYVKAKQKKGNKKNKPQKPNLEEYTSSTGASILVGKNNKQNDYLTNKIAHREEWWFHTKDIPGSHVVIKQTEPDDASILEAANLAAYFSKARNSSSVPVDYTKIKYVKKPSGSKPGFVIYDNQQTVYVTPNEDLVLQLKK